MASAQILFASDLPRWQLLQGLVQGGQVRRPRLLLQLQAEARLRRRLLQARQERDGNLLRGQRRAPEVHLGRGREERLLQELQQWQGQFQTGTIFIIRLYQVSLANDRIADNSMKISISLEAN